MIDKKATAISCIEILTAKYSLNPNLLKYFMEGKVYYTEEIVPYNIASMDNITYDQKYVDIINTFEEQNDVLVYHAILKHENFCMLFINGKNPWYSSLPEENGVDVILAAVFNLVTKTLSMEHIAINAVGGTLIRISLKEKIYLRRQSNTALQPPLSIVNAFREGH